MAIKMTDSKFGVDFYWIGVIPNNKSSTGARLPFFVECIHCDRWFDKHLSRCDSEDELIELFRRYEKRIIGLPFQMREKDFKQLAKNTWNDPEYQNDRNAKVAPQ